MVEIFVGKKAKMRYTSVENWVYRYVQSQYKTFNGSRRRLYGMGGWKLRKWCHDALSVYDSPGAKIIMRSSLSCICQCRDGSRRGSKSDPYRRRYFVQCYHEIALKRWGDSQPIDDSSISNHQHTTQSVVSTVMRLSSIHCQKMIPFLISESAIVRLSVLMKRVLVVSAKNNSTISVVVVSPKTRRKR